MTYPRRYTEAGREIVRYSQTGLFYLDDKYGYRSLAAARRAARRQ
jgi:hypothetical protein